MRPDYYQFMHDLTSAVSSVALANMTYCDSTRWLGGKAGERIDNRNSAMSMVSKLLGLPDLVAPAEPMTIIVDGQEIQGTFMENAYGKEVFGLKPDDPIHQYTIDMAEFLLSILSPTCPPSHLVESQYVVLASATEETADVRSCIN